MKQQITVRGLIDDTGELNGMDETFSMVDFQVTSLSPIEKSRVKLYLPHTLVLVCTLYKHCEVGFLGRKFSVWTRGRIQCTYWTDSSLVGRDTVANCPDIELCPPCWTTVQHYQNIHVLNEVLYNVNMPRLIGIRCPYLELPLQFLLFQAVASFYLNLS